MYSLQRRYNLGARTGQIKIDTQKTIRYSNSNATKVTYSIVAQDDLSIKLYMYIIPQRFRKQVPDFQMFVSRQKNQVLAAERSGHME
jgi:hypothetical protein